MAHGFGLLLSIAALTGGSTVVGDEQREDAAAQQEEGTFTDNFMASDIDKDGQLSRDEAIAFAKAENGDIANDPDFVKDVNADFDDFDVDKSGSLSLSEFTELLSSGSDADDEEREEDEEEGNQEEEEGEEEEEEEDEKEEGAEEQDDEA
eukprot:TRINITY_DN293_c0_g1_i12.p1 TRINITY_DN293_c0_g1~~TRINITY_DN293_c0_g1_i12.p1  ORF type:complete len:167 (+),score=64.43 TRINITY_DN293_c0_g1_i12:53-502(+)